MRITITFLSLVFGFAGAYAQATEIERIDVVEYGLYTASVESAKRSDKGVLQSTLGNIQHIETTRSVPARLGVRFGFRYKVIGEPAGAEVRLKKITTYPPGGLKNANGQTITTSETFLTRAVGGNVLYTGYNFDDAWELVPGPWTIELWHGDRKLVSQSFTVFKP